MPANPSFHATLTINNTDDLLARVVSEHIVATAGNTADEVIASMKNTIDKPVKQLLEAHGGEVVLDAPVKQALITAIAEESKNTAHPIDAATIAVGMDNFAANQLQTKLVDMEAAQAALPEPSTSSNGAVKRMLKSMRLSKR